MLKKLKITVVTSLASACLPMIGQAQDAGARLQNLQNGIDQRKLDIKPIAPSKKSDQTEKTNEPSQAKLMVKAFKLTGVTLIGSEQAQAVLAEFRGKELTFEQLQQAGRRVIELYEAIDRVATFVIPEQDVENGVIELRFIEVKVGEIIVNDVLADRASRLNHEVAKAFVARGNAKGQLISLKQLNRSKALLNELPSVKAEVALSKSELEASSDLQVSLYEGNYVTGRVEVSNSGSTSTGTSQGIVSLSIHNPYGWGDQYVFDAANSVGSRYATLKYWAPLGYSGWRIAPSISELDYQSLSNFSETSSKGNAKVLGLFATYALQREARKSNSVNLSFEGKQYLNFTNDTEASSYRIDKWTVGLSGLLLDENLSLSYAINAIQGSLYIDNAAQLSVDSSAKGANTAGSFSKLSAYASLLSELPLERTTLRTSFNGQLASKNLNSSEQIYLGGPDSVRAYPVAQGGGSQGLIASLEVTHTLNNGVQLGAFYDLGRIQQYKFNWSPELQGNTKAANNYGLRAIGLNTKYAWDNFQVQAAVAYRLGDNPLHTSTGAQLNTDNAYRSVQAWVKGSYSFN